MKLSANFDLDEFTRSDTATSKGIDNTPGEEHIANLIALCKHVLQPLRDHFGLPVKIRSGFRSQALNRAVGGAPNSQHTTGEAADIEIPGVANADIFRYIVKSLPFDQVIAELLERGDGSAGWIHVSYSRTKLRYEDLSFLGVGKGKGYVPGLRFIEPGA